MLLWVYSVVQTNKRHRTITWHRTYAKQFTLPAGEQVASRSPTNIAGAILRNVGSNPSGDGQHGSAVAWAWLQDNFAGSNAAQ